MRLYIDSGTHSFTDEQERINSVKSHLSSPTAVFTEDSTSAATWRDKLSYLLIAPLLIGTMLLWVHIILPFSRLFFGDDTAIEDYLVDEYSVIKIPTDKPKLDIISENTRLHLAANWLPIIITIILWRVQENPTLILVVLPFIIGVALFLTFLGSVNEVRDSHIASEIEGHANDHDEACLVIGEGHHEPVADYLATVDTVTVLTPAPSEE